MGSTVSEGVVFHAVTKFSRGFPGSVKRALKMLQKNKGLLCGLGLARGLLKYKQQSNRDSL